MVLLMDFPDLINWLVVGYVYEDDYCAAIYGFSPASWQLE
jgi:hypothetical protein